MPLLASLLLAAGGWQTAVESAGYDPAQVRYLLGEAGARDTGQRVLVRAVEDRHDPRLDIIWEQPASVPVFQLPAGAQVFAKDRVSGAPLAAAWLDGGKPVLWTATGVGERGFERFPFLPHALRSLGIQPRVEERNLWVFFDSSFRLRADLGYLAARWREGGVSAIHIAAWQYWEADAAKDEWLRNLVDVCHRNAILVYAWIELPHVSERFWEAHPDWREKTAAGQDAHLDWRKLMDLTIPECDMAVRQGLRELMSRFDWDGLNLGELYFESLEGAANPARFTPFAAHASAELRKALGFDPREGLSDPRKLRRLLDARAGLAAGLQRRWLAALAEEREAKPHLDLVLTHIDDRFDETMRDRLGADAARLLPVAQEAGATFLVEDPATVWHLGPERYAEIARRYAMIGAKPERLAIDLNIVERYQDVYPTKQQAGVELLQLVRTAARSFGRVALYFENSISRADWPLLAAASAIGRVRPAGDKLLVHLPRQGFVRFPGCALVNGEEWPAFDGERVLLPAGEHELSPCEGGAHATRLADFQGTLLRLERAGGNALKVEYESATRAIAVLAGGARRKAILLPPGRRSVTLALDED